jgi:hypothetical protein
MEEQRQGTRKDLVVVLLLVLVLVLVRVLMVPNLALLVLVHV